MKEYIRKLKIKIRSKKKVRLSRSIGGDIGIYIFLLLICAFMVLPILYSVMNAFKPLSELLMYPPRFYVKNPTLSNFSDIIYLTETLEVPFLRYLFNSLFVTIVGTTLYLLVATLAGYALAKGTFVGRKAMSSLVVWALLFNASVMSIPRYIVIAKLGLVDTYGAIILPALASTMGVFLIRQYVVAGVPNAILEAGRIDGASEFRILFHIVLPAVKPALMTTIIFTFQSMWNGAGAGEFIYSERLKELPTVLSTISAGGLARSGAAAAVALITMIPPIIVFLISQSSVMDTMTHSGLKG